jgi:hypothetical protein
LTGWAVDQRDTTHEHKALLALSRHEQSAVATAASTSYNHGFSTGQVSGQQTAVAAAEATQVAAYQAAPTQTAEAIPATAHVCNDNDYSPNPISCSTDDNQMSVVQASDGHLVVDASNSSGNRTVSVDVERVNDDGTSSSINTLNTTINANYDTIEWQLSHALISSSDFSNLYYSSGGIQPGKYQINVTVNDVTLPMITVLVYQ